MKQTIPEDYSDNETPNYTELGFTPEELLENIKRHVEPMRNMISRFPEFRERLESGEYVIIIGDDRSGRLVSLAMYQFLKRVYEEKQQRPPQIKFLTGSGDLIQYLEFDDSYKEFAGERREKQRKGHKKQAGLDEWAQSTKTEIERRIEDGRRGSRALVVTEVVETGKGLALLGRSLRKVGLEYDVVASALHDDTFLDSKEEKIGTKIFWGNRRNTMARLIDKEASWKLDQVFLGIDSGRREDIHSKKLEVAPTETVSLARKYVKELGDELFRWYKEEYTAEHIDND